jgi:arsenate reductase
MTPGADLPRRAGLGGKTMKRVLFACVHNAGRSQMAAAWLNALADPRLARASSAGTQPGSQVHDVVIEAMREVGIDLTGVKPQRLTPELLVGVSHLITMGCGEACPVAPPSVVRLDWPVADPKGRTLDHVRALRDEIRARVEELLASWR